VLLGFEMLNIVIQQEIAFPKETKVYLRYRSGFLLFPFELI